jgi:hypothetical protein
MKNDKKLAAFRAKKAAEVKLVHEQIHQLQAEIDASTPGTPEYEDLADQMMLLLFQGRRGPSPRKS